MSNKLLSLALAALLSSGVAFAGDKAAAPAADTGAKAEAAAPAKPAKAKHHKKKKADAAKADEKPAQ